MGKVPVFHRATTDHLSSCSEYIDFLEIPEDLPISLGIHRVPYEFTLSESGPWPFWASDSRYLFDAIYPGGQCASIKLRIDHTSLR